MSEPTPSPWHLHLSAFGATVWAGDEQAPKIVHDGGRDPEAVANARLIVAARDLLSLAQAIRIDGDRIVVGSMTNPLSIKEWEDLRQQAVAKANGADRAQET